MGKENTQLPLRHGLCGGMGGFMEVSSFKSQWEQNVFTYKKKVTSFFLVIQNWFCVLWIEASSIHFSL